MKTFIKIFVVTVLISMMSGSAYAVTQSEMEQARAISALWYLRFMNNKSDYLESLSPKNISELESQLKETEKKNIVDFKKVPVPKDYASWDKEKLVEYWGKTAFKGLDAEGCKAMPRVRKKIGEMQIGAPTNNEEKPAEETKQPEQTGNDPLSLVQDAPDNGGKATVDATPEQKANDVVEPAKNKKSSSSNMVYIILLIVLVLVVIGVVIYAMNSMKKRAEGGSSSADAATDDSARRKMNRALAEKDKRIAQLEQEIENLQAEIEQLKARATKAQTSIRSADSSYRSRPISPQNPRTIYLAHANNKGVFVRADAKYNMGNSIFKMVTTDGVSGTFSVIEAPEVYDMALTVPADYLMSACLGDSLQLANGMHQIVTDTPGTAIFEDGKWRVLRKARIHYER